MMKWFKFRLLEILLGILFFGAGISPLLLETNGYSTIICSISAVLIWFYPFFIQRRFLFWLISFLSFSTAYYSIWNLPKVDLWYPIFQPLWEPIIFISVSTFLLFKYFKENQKEGKKGWLILLFMLVVSAFSLSIRDKYQATKALQNLTNREANAHFADPLLSIFDLAEDWSNNKQFWDKYAQQEGWIPWIEEHYFKEKLTGFEIIDYKDTIASEIHVDLQEGYKTQIFQILLPHKGNQGLWISLERKSTPALLFDDVQNVGLNLPIGFSYGIYLDEMLQQNRGNALFSPYWKGNESSLNNQQDFLISQTKNGNRQVIAQVAFQLSWIFLTKVVWFFFISMIIYLMVNHSFFLSRWKGGNKFKIQGVVLGMVLLSAVIFSAYSIRIVKEQYHDEILRSKLQEVDKFTAQLREILKNSDVNNPTTPIRLNRLSRIWDIDFRLNTLQKKPIFQTFYFEQPIEFLYASNQHENWYSIKKQKVRSIQYLLQIPQKNIYFEWFLFNENLNQNQENLGKMIHFLAFILLVLIGFSWFVGNWLIQPFVTLRKQLILTGEKALIWKENDEIGELVQAYNHVLEKVKKQAESIAQQEKEMGWKNMARQVAHEIRNPLTPMKLQLQLLDRMPEGEKKQEQLSKTISVLLEQINSLERISTEFSAFANFPDPRFEMQDMYQVVKKATDLYSTEATIYLETPESINMAMDSEMIMRAIGNLIKNAIQAYDDTIEEKRIQIKIWKNKDHIEISVEDWAGGIPDHLLSQIFQPNFTTKNSGMGLGLSLIQRIIESHHGSIQLKVKPEEGCIFTLRFPFHVH